jgi:hypothetical protein
MYTLKNWYFEKNKDQYHVWGNVLDHPHFAQEQWISTSCIKEITLADDALILKTEHSVYQAFYADHQNKDARTLKKALHDYLWPLDEGLAQKIQYASHKAKEPSITADSAKICAVLVFDEQWKELQLKQRGHWKTITAYDVHSGMFHDETELSDPRLDYCFRFFSYEDNGYQFEEWQGKYTEVFLKNEGEQEIHASTVFGDFCIRPHACELLDPANSHARMQKDSRRTGYGETKVLCHGSLKIKTR